MRKVIGITGGIASGKSTICQYLEELGYPVIDSDAISRRLSLKGNSIYDAIYHTFGMEYFLADGELDRKKLGNLIFEDSKARDLLNSVTHPLIVEEIKNLLQKTKGNIIFLDIPLLFEAKLWHLCDTILCVYTDLDTQLIRLMERDKITRELAFKKIASQMSLEIKRDQSDYVIDSTGSISSTRKQMDELLKQIKGEIQNG